MNRIVLIGNGFDLAHNLPTKYEDFINWYWKKRIYEMSCTYKSIVNDSLCSLEIKSNNETWASFINFNHNFFSQSPSNDVIESLVNDKNNYEITFTPLFGNICKSIETKGWVDIENEYYKLLSSLIHESECEEVKNLNKELEIIKYKLIEYLTNIQENDITEDILNQDIKKKILESFKKDDIAVQAKEITKDFNFNSFDVRCKLRDIIRSNTDLGISPDNIMLLNFNYTKTADMYMPNADCFTVNHIHGDLIDPKSVIFGYGDELDDDYKNILKLNDNEYLHNIKSIKYLESDNYRKVLSFIKYMPYQIYIMGHSCGNSDRTLLNTLFEHKNCVSIKPFYFKKEDGTDNYLDMVQNISRNFTDMKLMRDRVVNKKYCEPLSE